MPVASTTGEQSLEASVTGPDGATRLITITGMANVALTVTGGQERTELWTFLVGPTLGRTQFHRAIATASFTAETLRAQNAAFEFRYAINSVDADWDDESNRVEVRVEVFLTASASMTLNLSQLRYSVTILGQL
jgi:hypothetical protein